MYRRNFLVNSVFLIVMLNYQKVEMISTAPEFFVGVGQGSGG